MNLREFTDEFAELDGQLLQASAQAEASLSGQLDIESRLAQVKRVTREEVGDRSSPGLAGDATE
ncbi:hypothetical protein OHA72_40210 [Dactylosporangium sp. NBC_01737]|uniref:hypothetical protein n=1 Tax=Dactylosporangium sp. NBC_01737 TaxID=2975959 RepID=UPI002E0DB117|nr:hypothetical protein OHA72_40210 [Dactylosporangium sp. NBC_01737]